ncbi:hypothetical protein VitviT2T_013431 [Vitis vinifera]|uniref:Uncharacterized protein n=1 Tax=Vitis vinifera TaxID=29760 RepID=A0ABY9CHS7_VITVI|nr:hypothetical protein VitviT2T_013431 [Vitis vinifera]
MFKRFKAKELVGHAGVDESTWLKLLLGSIGIVEVRGIFHGKNGLSRFRMERGLDKWMVDCSCGAKDDDGERMSPHDWCGVWNHSWCTEILDYCSPCKRTRSPVLGANAPTSYQLELRQASGIEQELFRLLGNQRRLGCGGVAVLLFNPTDLLPQSSLSILGLYFPSQDH